MAKKKTTPLGEADQLLEEFAHLERRAEALIAHHVAALAAGAPGVPKETIRACSVDAHGSGYSYSKVLRHLRTKLESK